MPPESAALRNVNASTTDQTQLREANSVQPTRSSCSVLSRACCGRHVGHADQCERERAQGEGGGVGGQAPAGADGGDEHAAQRRSRDHGGVAAEAVEGVGGGEQVRRHGLRHQGGGAGMAMALTMPLTALSPMSRGMVAVPVSTSVATAAWVRAPARWSRP